MIHSGWTLHLKSVSLYSEHSNKILYKKRVKKNLIWDFTVLPVAMVIKFKTMADWYLGSPQLITWVIGIELQ